MDCIYYMSVIKSISIKYSIITVLHCRLNRKHPSLSVLQQINRVLHFQRGKPRSAYTRRSSLYLPKPILPSDK